MQTPHTLAPPWASAVDEAHHFWTGAFTRLQYFPPPHDAADPFVDLVEPWPRVAIVELKTGAFTPNHGN